MEAKEKEAKEKAKKLANLKAKAAAASPKVSMGPLDDGGPMIQVGKLFASPSKR